MQNSGSSDQDRYIVPCHNCGADFDAVAAAWCKCITTYRTFACPACGECVCAAPQQYGDKFWKEAPRVLWERRRLGPPTDDVSKGSAAESRTTGTVLVVDDDRLIREIAVRLIRNAGYDVAVAQDGEEGYELARKLKPALIITDALMPKIDGRELCLRLKQDPETRHSKIVIMTSLYTSPRYMVEAQQVYRADGYLTKPVTPGKLREVLEQFVPADQPMRRRIPFPAAAS